MKKRLRYGVTIALVVVGLGLSAVPARALDRLCDPGHEDCRAILLTLIRNERVGIDVGFWFMEDARYTAELIKRFQAGVPVRVLVDPRANAINAFNPYRLEELRAAGIPMRKRMGSDILHYKMMLFAGQDTVEFSGANYSADAFTFSGAPYTNYTDESIYFTDDPSVVNSFRTKFDDLWINTSTYANYANIVTPLIRAYDLFPKNAELNFAPAESYASRAVARYNQETVGIDVVMYRITDRRHTDAIIAARARGIPVRLITEPAQYRDPKRLWHSWNVDRLYMAGIQIKHRAHAGLNHQKSVLLRGQRLSIFGSSNWTSASDASQEEHNYFTKKTVVYEWLSDQFDRKWNNTGGVVENVPFVPLPPDKATTPAPAIGAIVSGSGLTLKWYGGLWAHKYDIYLGTTPTPPLIAQNLELGPSQTTTEMQRYTLPVALAPGKTYYWRIVSKTMANKSKTGDLWSFSTSGTATAPTTSGVPGVGDIVLHAGLATVLRGNWQAVSDSTAAGGRRMYNRNLAAAKIITASAAPANYVEMTFNVVAGKAYRLWLRLKADSNTYSNDSVFVQFSGSRNASGTAQWRIGTTSAAEVNLESCSGCGVSGWGWQDNGYGSGVLGPLIYFTTTGTQTIRIQQREDGVSIDQIVLSPSKYLSSSPGALKNDSIVLPRQ
jgi:phosphatidylserine/phosphatidylglycerophosphate/cardiolipin synthase-like enzyme